MGTLYRVGKGQGQFPECFVGDQIFPFDLFRMLIDADPADNVCQF